MSLAWFWEWAGAMLWSVPESDEQAAVRYFHIREGLIYFQPHGFHPSSVAVDDGRRTSVGTTVTSRLLMDIDE